MALVLNVMWGDSWKRPKQGLADIVTDLQDRAELTREGYVEGDPTLDLYVYVSGAVWQHGREGFRLGTLSERGRNSLRVMIYVPDDLTSSSQAAVYFRGVLADVAARVRERLMKGRPDWPIDELVGNVLSL